VNKELSKVTLGTIKSNLNNLEAGLREQKLTEKQIAKRVSTAIENWSISKGISTEELIEQLKTVEDNSPHGIEARKKEYRDEFDRLTNNLLFAIANSTDQRVKDSHDALLAHDKLYQKLTGTVQGNRDDWRGLVMIKSHWTDNIFVINKGGWSDPVKREQYTNGRRVPVAKSTGYTREQPTPEWTDTP